MVANLRRVYDLGPRPMVELVLELANSADPIARLEELAERYCTRLDPVLLRATGADRFPSAPIRVVVGRR